jgi:lipopolysaccharide export system permease protein
MGIIIRYILRELGVTFLFGFVALTSLLLIVGLVRKALDESVPLIAIPQLVPYVFAQMSSISLPVTLLLAATIFFARMSGDNEVVALKSLGVPPKAFLMPVFAIAAMISVLGVAINELAVSWAPRGIIAIVYNYSEEIMLRKLKEDQRFETKNKQITILVGGMDDQNRLLKPTIKLKREGITITAESAQITVDFTEKVLNVTFVGMKAESNKGDFIIFPSRTFPISLSEFVPTGDSSRAAEMSLYKISEEKKKVAEQMEQQRRSIAAHRTFAAVMGSVNDWTKPEIMDPQTGAKVEISRLKKHYDRLSVEPPRRWATGFMCFFFVWLGAPLAIWMRKSDFFSSFFACFVPILILYFPLLMFGLSQAKNGTLPPMCVWIANVSIGLVGLWFLRQIHRY